MTEVAAVSTVGFIGLGRMGSPMTACLIAAGFRVLAYDVSADARAAAVAAGATEASDLASAVRGADAVILMLPDSRVVTSVLQDTALIEALALGTIVVDMSSSEPQRTRELAADLGARGIYLVDAPVSGGVKGAERGALTIMVGGADDHLDRLRPVLDALGTVIHAGGVGAGHAVKALNNLLSATHLWVTSEVMSAGMAFGLDPATMLSIFNGSSGRSGSTENKWPNFILPGTFDSGFGLRLMLKDMKIAVQLADQSGAPTELGADAVALWTRASEDLEPGADHTEVARWIQDNHDCADAEGTVQLKKNN